MLDGLQWFQPLDEAPAYCLHSRNMASALQDHHMEVNEPLGVPSELSDPGQLCGQHADKSPVHLMSWRDIPVQRKYCDVPPSHLPPAFIPNPSGEMVTVVITNLVYVDCLHSKGAPVLANILGGTPSHFTPPHPPVFQCHAIASFSVITRLQPSVGCHAPSLLTC